MSARKTSPQRIGIAVRVDAKGREQFRGTAYDPKARKHLKGSWTPNLAEARAWRVDALAGLQAGTLSADRGLTVRAAVEQFVAGVENGSIRTRSGSPFKPSVRRDYRRDLDNRIAPLIGASYLSELTVVDMQRVVDALGAQGIAPSTQRNAIMGFRSLIAWARPRGHVRINPCEGLRLPTGERKRERIAAPDEAAMLTLALPLRDRAAFGLACYAGLRAGELMALDWSHVDLERRAVRIERGWDHGSGAFIAAKSKAAERTVPITARLLALLADHAELTGGKGLLFASTTDPERPQSHSGLLKRMHASWARAGLEPLGLHEARHTFASILIASGANAKAITTYMGHAGIAITFDRYGHLMPGSEAEVRGLLDTYLMGDPR